MAVAYATYRAPGEAADAQLERFGQVMQGVLRKKSSDDPRRATITVQTLAQILDPSLTEKDLGAFLAKLADHAKGGDYKTALLPVQSDGTLSAQASRQRGQGHPRRHGEEPRRRATPSGSACRTPAAKDATEAARVVLVNGGYTVVDRRHARPAQVLVTGHLRRRRRRR